MPNEEASIAEQEYEKALKERGFAIVTEEPEHTIGNMTHHRVVIKKIGTDEETEALGEDREAALKSAYSISHAV